jgi:hypothetical protein
MIKAFSVFEGCLNAGFGPLGGVSVRWDCSAFLIGVKGILCSDKADRCRVDVLHLFGGGDLVVPCFVE